MAYPKRSKAQANEAYLRSITSLNEAPYIEDVLEQKKLFLIVCEGENTEPCYFRSFPVPTKTVEVVGGHGGGKIYLVDEAKRLSELEKYCGYEVWCVFDYDVKPGNPHQPEDFDNAITNAEQYGFKIAFSNDCFELWFLLHYDFIQNQHHRTEYYDKLTNKWGLSQSYESIGKELGFCKNLYSLLLPKQDIAIKAAKKLYADLNDGRPYHEMNPCTTVHLLVEELNKNLKE